MNKSVVLAELAYSTYCYCPGGVWGWWWVIVASALPNGLMQSKTLQIVIAQ